MIGGTTQPSGYALLLKLRLVGEAGKFGEFGLVVKAPDSKRGVPYSKPLEGSKIDSVFHPLRSIKLAPGSSGNFVLKSKLSPCSGSAAVMQLNPFKKQAMTLRRTGIFFGGRAFLKFQGKGGLSVSGGLYLLGRTCYFLAHKL